MNDLRSFLLSIFLTLGISLTWVILAAVKTLIALGEKTYFLIYSFQKNTLRLILSVYFLVKYIVNAVVKAVVKSLHFAINVCSKAWRTLTLAPSKSFRYLKRSIHSSFASARKYLTTSVKVMQKELSSFTSSLLKLFGFIVDIPYKSILKIRNILFGFGTKIKLFAKKLSNFAPRVTIKVHPPHTPLPKKLLPKKRKKYLIYITIAILFLGFAASSYYGYLFYESLPRPQDIGKINFSLTSHVFDRNGKKLFDFYKDQNRTPIKLNDLPKYVYTSTIAIEDKDFYSHNGVAPISGIARALRDWIVRKQGVQGGSTITQQLVKTALLSPERTITRKIKEMIIALETEKIYTKDKILEMYLNQVPYGGTVYGIEEASNRYFRKHAKDLTLSEAALLAGLPQAPSEYSPYTNMSAAIARRDQVLRAMLEQEYISRVEFIYASREKLNFSKDTIDIAAPHFVFYVRQYLEDYFEDEEVEQKGYKITTSLDLDVQKKVEIILLEELEKIQNLNVSNGAILVTKPATGEVLAMVGSKDFFSGESGEFNVTTGLRQPGSSIKPILYALAMQKGATSATVIDDSPTTYRISQTETYKPVNYDGRFHGRVTLRSALANSYNIPAVKLMDSVGVVNFLEFSKEAGIDTWNDPSNYGLSLALGGGDVTMVDMAESYSMIANYGRRTDLNPIMNIINGQGQVLKPGDVEVKEVIPSETAYILSDILSDNNARAQAFGTRSSLEIPGYKVAVKTGTTDEKRDNWTIGYTPDFLVVVWVGNNDHTPMNPYLTSGITGAAPIWNRVMTYLLAEYSLGQKNWYTKPGSVVEKNCLGRPEVFVSGTENSVPCSIPTPAKTAENKR